MSSIAPYGAWQSPITAEDVAASSRTPQWVGTHGGQVWWAEARPAEGGRIALLRAAPGEAPHEVLSAPWNARNRVHEYGGRPWAVVPTPAGDRLVFTHWDDQRVYLVDPADPGALPRPISPEPERLHGHRYAEPTASPDGAEVWCVRETVTGDLRTDVRRDLVALPVDGGAADDPAAVRVLAASHHFLSGPKPSPDGRHVAWFGWDHPAMPWDGTELCVAELTDGEFGPHRVVAGGPTEAVCQFEWDDAETLCALTDPDGWWNLYRIGLDGEVRNLHPCEEELGGPLWQMGPRWFARLGGDRYAVLRAGRLAVLDAGAGRLSDVDSTVAGAAGVWGATLAADGEVLAGVVSGPRQHPTVVRLDLGTGELAALGDQPASSPDPRYLPEPQPRVFPGPNGEEIPAYVYPPTNPDYEAPDGERPPYLVHVHGGPTGRVFGVLQLDIAYFTSRGIGVVAVNYGGSTGYGRAFRERLRENWGVVDVADCAAVAEALAAEGAADPERLAVRGGSAGGWTTAASLTSVRTYRCGTAMFPILDLTGWSEGETHDFESRYLDGLVGPLPETADRYRNRSPVNRVDHLAGPILLLQGLEDEICPPEQSLRLVDALAGRGIPHAYLAFPGEQHGFRRAETIVTALRAELSFYGQVLGFDPPGVPRLELRH
ncbi:prolyl oligopeptidase family serine peptidase [Streptoalloteichus hindustanus]|uniref:Dipeptidyl aminopeptidase/acylaminoacyl peptidase n=1 Tax=Streptoalloteichus hindustanus TaxID=2017 RepID=A0A1M5FQX5_STRHI|nr:prolyl oligopeptidase family serine peptidase [Streptoalloteichus hindustanus]SHF93896.1 Dipeptidyl aminopeptidase/acylaminoacyl peptidase [Streptoalloteichus hindustanus]